MSLLPLLLSSLLLFPLCSAWNWPSWGGGSSGSTTPPPSTSTTTTPPSHYVNLTVCPLRTCEINYRKDINCAQSGCTSISSEIPTDVDSLHLQHNSLTEINRLPYGNLTNLDLSNNNISIIADDAFYDLKHLTSLYLSTNRITTLKRTYFRALRNVKYIHMDHNLITKIPSDVFFPFLPSIEKLDLSYNQISEIENSATSDISSLLVLNLEYNNLSSIDKSNFLNLDRLQEIKLSNNRIKSITPGTFSDLRSLLWLDLSYNEITILQNGSFSLDNAFQESQITRLVLSNNNLIAIESGVFKELTSLQILHLEYNPIKIFPANALPKSLRIFEMHHMPNLKTLRAETFEGLEILDHVDISHNRKLDRIEPRTFSTRFKKLRLLDVSRSGLERMGEDVMVDWADVEDSDLSGNRWSCDCHVIWMLDVPMRTEDRGVIRCASPSHLSGTLLIHVPRGELLCGTMARFMQRRGRLGLGLLVFATLIFITGMFAFIFKCRHKIFPCRYGQTSKYRALYNQSHPGEAGGEEGENVQFSKSINVSENEKKLLQEQANGDLPAPVAL